jgi:hypothetical protein
MDNLLLKLTEKGDIWIIMKWMPVSNRKTTSIQSKSKQIQIMSWHKMRMTLSCLSHIDHN